MTNIQLVSVNDEVRVDSRLIADRLGIENRSAVQTITNYIDDFNEFGLIPMPKEVLDEVKAHKSNSEKSTPMATRWWYRFIR